MSNSTSTNTENYETWLWNLGRFCRENDYTHQEAVDFLWHESDATFRRFSSRLARESSRAYQDSIKEPSHYITTAAGPSEA